MPTTTTEEAIKTTQEQILSAVRQSQEAMVKAITVWSQTVAKAVPELPVAAAGRQAADAREARRDEL